MLPSETWLQEKAAALEALVTGRRTAKQTEADTIASTIRKAAEQRKAAVNDWVDSRTELREMVRSATLHYTCCYDEINGIQDFKICSRVDSLSLSLFY